MSTPDDNCTSDNGQDVRSFPSPWGDESAYLGTFTNTASASQYGGANAGNDSARRAAFKYRYALQSAARELLPDHRVAWCLRRPLPGFDTVDVMHSVENGRAYYANLMTCGRLWECPVCAARITEQRRDLLHDLLKDTKYNLAMLTFTVQHSADESCVVVLDRLLSAYRRFTAGRWFQGLKEYFGIVGTLKGLELTHGANGWHPHLHVLILVQPGLQMLPGTNIALELYIRVSRRWSDVVGLVGGYASADHGVDLTLGNEHLGLYVAKLSSEAQRLAHRKKWSVVDEVTKYPTKRARTEAGATMLELLADYLEGNEGAGELWREAVAALYGKKHLSPSRGFWSLLGRDDDKVPTDDELAQERIALADVMLASLTLAQWRQVCAADARAGVLTVAADGDGAALWAYLEGLGIERPAPAAPSAPAGRWLRVDVDGCKVELVDSPDDSGPIYNGRRWEW